MLTELQTIFLTCLLGPEDKNSFRKFRQRERARERRQKDPEADREKVRKWRKDNREKVLALGREASRKWQREHPELVRVQQKAYREKSPKKIRTEASRLKIREYMAIRRLIPEVRLAHGYRETVRGALKRSIAGKAAKTFHLVGCSSSELMAHLESQFKPGMTWENYGPVWHVDHIKPCAKFDLTDPEQQRICFCWENLQPLFAAENIAKGSKYVG